MKRVAGRYKRRSQWLVFAFAIIVSIFFNVDTLRIANRLYYDSALRAATADQARAFDKSPSDFPKSISQLRVPIGWPEDVPIKEYLCAHPFVHFFGLLFSIVALSLGAPFWFDTLNKFVNVRQAGTLPTTASKVPIITP
jgi:hypothetical protein